MNYECKRPLLVYPYSYGEAKRRGEELTYETSFRENVRCAHDIGEAVYQYFDAAAKELKHGCAECVLQRYGFLRINFVLANTVQIAGYPYALGEKAAAWSRDVDVPQDDRFLVNAAGMLLSLFIDQLSEIYHALGFFGAEHCITGDKRAMEYAGKVLLLKPNIKRGSCWTHRDQLWYAHSGPGCSPYARFDSIQASCLSSGEKAHWLRLDFAGVFDERYLPDWAVENLNAIRASLP